ncbi:MAG: cytochrome c oxidase subunit II [Gammaproteobacteria bacterium]|nr:cytochrome c oxidase subunit II [Gammaproteobacteria bacterium]
MHRVATTARQPLAGLILTVLALPAQAAWELNMTQGVTSISHEAYDLHMLVLWICTIVGIGVFAVMIYAIATFRKSKGAVPATFSHSTYAEMIWTIIPTLILIFLAYETAPALIRIEDTSNSEMTIKITGYQWKWQYEYVGQGYSFFSTLAESSNAARQLNSGVNPRNVGNYLLEVDHPLVVPTGVKIRYLLTGSDVIHAWWVPAFSIKRDAIPGYVNEGWFKVDKAGVYRGQCAELCGKDHGFMPIVVEALPRAEFEAWLTTQKLAATPATVAAN